MTVLAAEGLVARRGGRNVVDGVSLEVARGEVVGLVGPSGSGKSTTLLLLAGLEPPDAGVVRVDGEDLGRLGEAGRLALRRDRLALVFQGYGLLSLLTARARASATRWRSPPESWSVRWSARSPRPRRPSQRVAAVAAAAGSRRATRNGSSTFSLAVSSDSRP